MATKRKRVSGSFEYVIRRKSLLPKPIYLTFDNEVDGDAYVKQLESLLDVGIVPPEYLNTENGSARCLGDVVRAYLSEAVQGDSDIRLLNRIYERWGAESLVTVSSYAWIDSWVAGMKRADRLSPGTIKHYVGALARCLDWALTRQWVVLNPCRMLPKRYSQYSAADTHAAGSVKVAVERDRRLEPGEEARIRAVLAGAVPDGRQRALELRHVDALCCLFDLALESAMRMREMFTLTYSQIDFEKRTIFLDKTKNGDKRQVPLSSVAITLMGEYVGEGGHGLIFPWWDGEKISLSRITSRLSKQFGRIFSAAGCDDLRFHDLRHEATSRLYERTQMSDLKIAQVTGHKDLRMLKRYANLRGSDLADEMW